MLLNGGGRRLRIFLLTVFGLLGVIFLWATSDTDSTQLKEAVASWPAAVASHFAFDGGGSQDGDPGGFPYVGGGRKYDEPVPPPPALPPTGDSHDAGASSMGATGAPYFVLIGDSTTCGQAKEGGGWGDAFLWQLARGAQGVNYGVNGALSTGYFHSPIWNAAMQEVRTNALARPVYVTVQFGHNDQNPNSNVTLDMYQDTLVGMAREVLEAGGTPFLVTPLARRDFDLDGTTVTDNLKDYRERTLQAHAVLQDDEASKKARAINLNAASLAYIGAIGKTAAFRYNKWHPLVNDTTHLNELGATVFARIVADLMLGHPAALVPSGERDPWAPGAGNDDGGLSGWIRPDPYMTGLVWHGDPI
ncbi:esterase [Sporothrix schenckii 1099-18]|uniref:Esterase n=1 Tax=Sporothrix schenckii 1099-18 TaxID=1397361 RepID=A0A0F2MMC7_SPOSC|nr:esterase [Sporothrix schenckii 1099-18]KJR89975.1 esterase [Sporothrix schenckii 1099-18]